jgi:hypothetical protein
MHIALCARRSARRPIPIHTVQVRTARIQEGRVCCVAGLGTDDQKTQPPSNSVLDTEEAGS